MHVSLDPQGAEEKKTWTDSKTYVKRNDKRDQANSRCIEFYPIFKTSITSELGVPFRCTFLESYCYDGYGHDEVGMQ